MATIGTYNEEGVNVDLYIPRKCHATNTLIASYDYSSVQIAIANVDANGMADGTTTTLCITGSIRAQGEADHAINHICVERGIVRIKSAKPKAKKNNKKKVAAKPAAAAKPQGKGKAAAPQKGAKPQGQKGAKPQGQKGQAPRKNAPARK